MNGDPIAITYHPIPFSPPPNDYRNHRSSAPPPASPYHQYAVDRAGQSRSGRVIAVIRVSSRRRESLISPYLHFPFRPLIPSPVLDHFRDR